MKKLSFLLIGAMALIFSTQTASAQANINVNGLDTKYNVFHAGAVGIRYELSMEMTGLKGEQVSFVVVFKDTEGSVLQDKNSKYNVNGAVAILTDYVPKHDNESVVIMDFMPYAELDLGPGTHNVVEHVEIRDSEFNLIDEVSVEAFSIDENYNVEFLDFFKEDM